jgi:hypothetical protein
VTQVLTHAVGPGRGRAGVWITPGDRLSVAGPRGTGLGLALAVLGDLAGVLIVNRLAEGIAGPEGLLR